MPAKAKKGRGTTVSLGEFTGVAGAGGVHDWAEEEWDGEGDQPQDNGDHLQGKEKAEYLRKLTAARYNHDGTKLGTQVGFREAPEERLRCMIPKDMPPPYVAAFNNLSNGITEEELRDEFHPDVIVKMKLMSRERATFAFIEFNTVDALHGAILMNGKIIKKRPVRVDVANSDQIERMNRGDRAAGSGGHSAAGGAAAALNVSRDGMGATQPGSGGGGAAGFSLDRDAFGAQQPQATPAFPGFGRGMRSSGSLTNLGELSRDIIGSAQPQKGAQPQSPTSGGGLADLGNWRDSAPVAQPLPAAQQLPGHDAPAARPALRENRKSDEGVDRIRRERKPDGSATAAAVGGGFGLGNWRDEVPVAQPQAPQVASTDGPSLGEKATSKDETKRPKRDAPTGSSASGTERTGSGNAPVRVLSRDDKAKPHSPVAAAANDNRWETLRK